MAALHKIAAICVTLAAVLWFLRIPSPAAQSDQGVLEIQVKDHREAIDDFARLNITIEKILISPKAGFGLWPRGWMDLGAPSGTVDLTKYVGKNAQVFRSSIDAGSFNAFHLRIKSIEAVLRKNQRDAPVKNAITAVQVPFEVPAKGETTLVIDLVVADFSDHPPRGYELGIRGYEIRTNGKLRAKIPPG